METMRVRPLFTFKGTPYGRARLPALADALSVVADHRRGERGDEREAPPLGAREEGGIRRSWATAWPAPLARERTSAGHCRHAGSPAPVRRRVPSRHTPPVAAPARASRAVLPRRASCRRAKLTVKGAHKGTSPAAIAQAPPLTLIFHGKIGACREDSAVPGRP